jgi:hypothetical protein
LTSVDVVTVAGAGGKFLNLLESYTRKDAETTPVTESVSEGNGMSITKEEFDAAIADLKTAFVEAITPVVESVSILAEAAKPAEVDEVETIEEVVESVNPVDMAVKFNESGTALVSGFSPAIVKPLLSGDMDSFTPEAVMLKTIMDDRYAVM